MLNIFNLQLLQQYNHQKAQLIHNINYRDRINEQITKKIKKSNIAAQINNSTALNELISKYLDSKLGLSIECENDELNKILHNKNSFSSPYIVKLEDKFNSILDNLINFYSPFYSFYNITNKIGPNANLEIINLEDQPFIKYFLKKLAIFYIYFQLYENETTFIKSKANELYEEPLSKNYYIKEIATKSNRLIIIPFLRQHLSENCSLVITNKAFFGNISKDFLKCFFDAPININPFNYKYWGQTVYTNKLRNSYTSKLFLSFIDIFQEILRSDKLNSLEFALKQELLELSLNINFIFFNSFLSPLHWFKKIKESDELDQLKDWICRFYYNATVIPMPAYRIYLSYIFNMFTHYEIAHNSFDLFNSPYSKTNIFNANIERLANYVTPLFLNNIDYVVKNKYSDNINQLKNDLLTVWKSIQFPNSLVSKNYYKILNTNTPMFTIKNNEIIPYFAEEVSKILLQSNDIDFRKEIIKNSDAEIAFRYLHELVYSSSYYSKNSIFLNEYNEKLHSAPQIDNYDIINAEKAFIEWCREYKDKYDCLKNLSDI